MVLIQSVILISKYNRKTPQLQGELDLTEVKEQPTVVKTVKDPVYQINLTAKNSQLSLSQNSNVAVKLTGSSEHNVDSVNVYVKYDPEAFEVSNLKFGTKLPKPAFSKVSTLRGLVVANFLISDAKGLNLKKGEELAVMDFDIKPKKTGNFDFEISTGQEMKESATMIVENGTAKVLPFTSNKLTVTVAR